jgi:hypothetical protein
MLLVRQVIAQETNMPQAHLQERVQALLNVLPGMDAKLKAMKPADVVSRQAGSSSRCTLQPGRWL